MRQLTDNPLPSRDESLNAATGYRRVEITVEREVLSVEYQTAPNIGGWCEQCGKDVLLLAVEAAAAAQGISPREIYRWVEESKLHFQESPNGTVFICSESLLKPSGLKQRVSGEMP